MARYPSAGHVLMYHSPQPSTDLSIPGINTREVDFADELYFWWFIGIFVAAMHLQGVDSILMHALKLEISKVLKW
jgi:hypothetical protein